MPGSLSTQKDHFPPVRCPVLLADTTSQPARRSAHRAALWAANIKRRGKVVGSYERYLKKFQREIHDLLAADRRGEGRGIQASRRIGERISKARSTAAGLVRELGQSEEVSEAAVATGEAAPCGEGDRNATGEVRPRILRSAAAQRESDKARKAFEKLGVQ